MEVVAAEDQFLVTHFALKEAAEAEDRGLFVSRLYMTQISTADHLVEAKGNLDILETGSEPYEFFGFQGLPAVTPGERVNEFGKHHLLFVVVPAEEDGELSGVGGNLTGAQRVYFVSDALTDA